MTCIRDQYPRDIVKPAGMKNGINRKRSVERKERPQKIKYTHTQTWPQAGKTMTSTATISIYTCIFPVLK